LAIAIGILVDGAVVVVENIHTQLNRAPKGVSKLHIVYRATTEVATPVISGVLIIIVVFLPIFSLTGLEGKMFMPLAVTISFALIGSLILSLTIIPVFASFLMRGGEEHDGWLLGGLKKMYRPVVNAALNFRLTAVGLAVVALIGALSLFPYIGKEFMPLMNEGSTVIIVEKSSDVSLKHSLAMDGPIHKAFMEIDEVVGVVARTGADELRMDPMGLYQTDNFIITKPKDEWSIDQDTLREQLREKLTRFEGLDIAFTQPIDMRVSEMLTGSTGDVSIKVFGNDVNILAKLANDIAKVTANIEGSTDVQAALIEGGKYLNIKLKPEIAMQAGMTTAELSKFLKSQIEEFLVATILQGKKSG